jgi:hypothetical protein
MLNSLPPLLSFLSKKTGTMGPLLMLYRKFNNLKEKIGPTPSKTGANLTFFGANGPKNCAANLCSRPNRHILRVKTRPFFANFSLS